MLKILEKLIGAVNHQGASGAPCNAVALEAVLRRSWAVMGLGQRRQLLASSEIAALGVQGDLVRRELDQEIAKMQAALTAAGYAIRETGPKGTGFGGTRSYYWRTCQEASKDFCCVEDAVGAAFVHLQVQSRLAQEKSSQPS